MAEALQDLLGLGQKVDATTSDYISYLAGQPVDALRSSERQLLSQASNSALLSIQSLSKKSYKAVVGSADSHASLRETIPALSSNAARLNRLISNLDSQVEHFSASVSKTGESKSIARRRQVLKLLENADRLTDLMQVPTLLSSTANVSPLGFSSTLDLYGHIQRLGALYPNSQLVSDVLSESEASILRLAADLINTLKAPNLKLAATLRTVGWLKRAIPDLISWAPAQDMIPAVFLICRFITLAATLDALEPLRLLAEDERLSQGKPGQSRPGGQHTERFLKRFIEVFREHSFGIVSMSKSVDTNLGGTGPDGLDLLHPLPSALSTFPIHLVNMLLEPLRIYLPAVKDKVARESILTQVLYCAGSLGRLGADFGMLLAMIGVSEWVDLVKRHRLLAGRLESVIGDYRRHFVFGLGSGVASAVLLQPLDLLKTRTQQSGRPSLLTGIWRELTQSPQPIRALWRGTLPSSLRTGFGSALYFTTLNSLRQFLQKSNAFGQRIHAQSSSSSLPSLTPTANMVSGAVARTWAGFVMMPLTVIKVRFESSLYSYPSMWAAVKDIHHQGGLRGFFAGFGATAIRDGPYAGMYVTIYEMMKRRLSSLASQNASSAERTKGMSSSVASSVNFASAILAGTTCSAISNPIDVCKTRIQLQPERYRNLVHAGYRMVVEEGFRSLWRGLGLRMSRKALSSALSWTIYEELIRSVTDAGESWRIQTGLGT
ncbi:mitochondrial carrier domain-containing protein [Trichoderma chlorosporum]